MMQNTSGSPGAISSVHEGEKTLRVRQVQLAKIIQPQQVLAEV